MTQIRFTVVDQQGTASFVGPSHAIKMLVAGCARFPRTLAELLETARRYDAEFVTAVRSGLSVFDEHNTPDNTAAIHAVIDAQPPVAWPPFRVLDARTRDASLEPVGHGLIMINLDAHKIIQVQNSYADVLRSDRGRVRQRGRPTRLLYHYRLPAEWRILP